MIETALGIAKDNLNSIGVPYEFMRWTSPVEDRYWIGEYSETVTDSEYGYGEGTLILTGTTRNSWSVLMQDRKKIQDQFPTVGGLRTSTDNGVVVFFYDNSFPTDTGEADLKRIQINIHIKMWKGMK